MREYFILRDRYIDCQTKPFKTRDKMVKMPDTILRNLSAGTDKTIRFEEVKNALIFSGYGPNKASKWIKIYIDLGALQVVRNDDPNEPVRLTSPWW